MAQRLLFMTAFALCVFASWAQEEAGVCWTGWTTPYWGGPSLLSAPITVSASGESQGFPDIVIVRFALIGNGETVAAARQVVQKSAEELLEAIGRLGIPRQRVELQNFEITPLQTQSTNISSNPASGVPFGFRVVQGYALTMPIDVSRIDVLSQLIDVLVEKGARMGLTEKGYDSSYSSRSPTSWLMEFVITDTEPLVKQATEDAIARARQMAGHIASRVGQGNPKIRQVRVNSVMHTLAGEILQVRYGGEPATRSIRAPSWRPVRVYVDITAEFETDEKR